MKNKFGLFSGFILGVLSLISISFIDMIISPVSAETIVVHKLKTSPVLDGKDNDWSKIPAVVVSLKKTKPDAASLVTKVRIKAGATKDDVFFILSGMMKQKTLCINRGYGIRKNQNMFAVHKERIELHCSLPWMVTTQLTGFLEKNLKQICGTGKHHVQIH